MENILRNLPQPTTRQNNHGFTREIIVIYGAIFFAIIVLLGIFAEYEQLIFYIEEDVLAKAGIVVNSNDKYPNGNPGNNVNRSGTADGMAAPLVRASPMGITDAGRFAFFQATHLFVYIGFGFLTSFLCHGMLSATGHTMIAASLASFFAILARGFFGAFNFGEAVTPLTLNIRSIIEADFAAAAVLISFGAVIGRLTVPQLLAMAFLEVVFYAFNEARVNAMGAADVGGAMCIHLFGAVFGVVVSAISCFDRDKSDRYNKASDVSTALSMIGSLFLFVYFPSFNAAAANSEQSMTRSVVNSYLSISCSCICTFFLEMFFEGKMTGWKLQRATLAGGVAVSSVSNMAFSPFRASIAGVLASVAVHFGEKHFSPILEKLGITDTCKVHLYHGMPGLLGGFLALFGSLYASTANYDRSMQELRSVFPLMGADPNIAFLTSNVTTAAAPIGDGNGDYGGFPSSARTKGGQAIAQLAAMCVTLIVAVVGGALTGLVMRFLPDPEAHFHDSETYVVDHVPDCTPSPELREKLESRHRRFELQNRLTELHAKSQKAFEQKDAAASRAAHKEEFRIIKALMVEAQDKEKARKKKEKRQSRLKMRMNAAKRQQNGKKKAAAGEHDEEEEKNENEQNKPSASAAAAVAVVATVQVKEQSPTTDDASTSSSSSSSDSSSSDDDVADELLVHPEPHSASGGDTLKTVVFGALDGIMTTFAVVTAAAGGNQGWKLVVAYGFAHLLADAFSMGFGSYIGDKAELDNAIAERKRESWENQHNPEGEIREMIEIYVNRGFDKADAERLVRIHAKDHERFVDFMMKEELEIDVDVEDVWAPVHGSLVMFWSFVAFGSLPMLPYLSQTGRGVDAVFIASCALVGFGLLSLGALKGALTGLPVARTALSMLVSGILSGGISYYVGVVVAQKILGDVDPNSIGGML